MPATWPSTLPQDYRGDGLQVEAQSTIIRNEMSWGPPKQRRKFSSYAEKVTCNMYMTLDQLNTLYSFYDNTLMNGSDTFYMKHPISGQTKLCRFFERFTYTFVAGGIFDVTLKLEFLP